MDKQGLNTMGTLKEELLEECGITEDQIIKFHDKPIEEYFMMAGCSDAKMYIYRIDVTAQEDKVMDDADVEQVVWLTREEVVELSKNGEFKDSKTKLALYHFLND